jgi:hypothetical protein
VKCPREPIALVWLVLQPADAKEPMVAFTTEFPHPGDVIGLAADGRSYLCPFHQSNFTSQGKTLNQIHPRPINTLPLQIPRA